jgi:hypothetical protein
LPQSRRWWLVWFIYRGADAATSTRRAYDAVFGMVRQQAAMLSFNQVFWLVGTVLVDGAAGFPNAQACAPRPDCRALIFIPRWSFPAELCVLSSVC